MMQRNIPYFNFLDPNDPPKETEIREARPVEKVLTRTDLDNGQLRMPKGEFKEYILSQLPPEKKNAVEHGERLTITVRDLGKIMLNLSLWKNAAESYVLTNGWKEFFVKRLDLKIGEKVGLRWDHAEALLDFSVISRQGSVACVYFSNHLK